VDFDPLGYFSRLAAKRCPLRELGNGILQGKFPRKNQGFPQKRLPNRLFIIVSMGVESARRKWAPEFEDLCGPTEAERGK